MSKVRYPGQRSSYNGQLCTVRYSGPVKGTDGEWIGVEWDDTRRGKHDGSRDGVRYFDCLNKTSTAGSFIRPSRPADASLGFLEALRKKYASGSEPKEKATSEDEIRISGKTVEEVGFEKIRSQLANLQELQIAILDDLRIAHLEGRIRKISTSNEIDAHDLKIVELDLSRNLLESWMGIAAICAPLKSLRSLKLNGNRFRATDCLIPGGPMNHFPGIEDLALDSTLLCWDNIASLTTILPSLRTLSISANGLTRVTSPMDSKILTTLNLSSNNITSLNDIATLTALPKLTTLSLRDNPLRDLTSPSSNPIHFPSLKSLDLSSTHLPNLPSLIPIPSTFPALTTLLTKNTPLSTLPSSNLHTIARLATLKELNYQPITPAERQNAELYYLSTIAKELATADEPSQKAILTLHPRWSVLCEAHGTPDISKPKVEAAAGTLGARVTEFTFYMAPNPTTTTKPTIKTFDHGAEKDQAAPATTVEKRKLIPLTVDTYCLKGIVTRLFSLPPLECKLIWETGELDPVAGREDEEGWSVSEDDSDEDGGEKGRLKEKNKDKDRWVQREVELVDGTREVGNLVEGKKVRVRVEAR